MSRAPRITGNILIDAAMAELNKNKTLVSRAVPIKMVPPIPTGSLGLDLATKIGGLPQGRIIEIYGPEASSKTSLCLSWAARAQKMFPEKFILIVDMEHTITDDFLQGFGIDPDRIVFGQAETVGDAFQIVMDMTKTGQFCFVVFDSIDACQTEAMLKKQVGDADVGGISKVAARFFREYSKVTVHTNTTAVFINQAKQNPSPFGGETTPGGTSLRFYATLRIRASQIKESKTMKNAYVVTLVIKKNKLGPRPRDEITFDFIYGVGPDPVIDTLNAAKDVGVLAFQGPTLQLREGDKKTPICKGGSAGWLLLCQQEPSWLDRIRDACIAAKKTGNEIPADPEEEPLPEELAAQLEDADETSTVAT